MPDIVVTQKSDQMAHKISKVQRIKIFKLAKLETIIYLARSKVSESCRYITHKDKKH